MNKIKKRTEKVKREKLNKKRIKKAQKKKKNRNLNQIVQITLGNAHAAQNMPVPNTNYESGVFKIIFKHLCLNFILYSSGY